MTEEYIADFPVSDNVAMPGSKNVYAFMNSSPPEDMAILIVGFDGGVIEWDEELECFVDEAGYEHHQYYITGCNGRMCVITPIAFEETEGGA